MRPFALFLPALLAGLASALPNPQAADDVNSDDVLRTADNAGRYGQEPGDVNPDLISELFGSGSSGQNINENYAPPETAKQTVSLGMVLLLTRALLKTVLFFVLTGQH